MTEASDIVRISTADGATLAARRRRGDGPPVLMLHGLAVNAALWDLPTIEGPGFVFRSLATELQERGYDVWLLNFRGHGAPSMLSRPPAGQSDWSLDEFVVFDLPAAIEHVRRETQRAPFVVGASMGSMVAAAWLTGLCRDADVPRGAESAGVKVSVSPGVEAPVSGGVDASSRGGAGWPGAAALRIDPLAAAARQRSIAGVVLVEFPAALRWPRSMYDEAGRPRWDVLLREFWRNDGDANFPFEVLARLGWLEALVTAARCAGVVSLLTVVAFGSTALAAFLFTRMTRGLDEHAEIHRDNVAVAIFHAFVLLAITAVLNEGMEDLSRSLVPFGGRGVLTLP